MMHRVVCSISDVVYCKCIRPFMLVDDLYIYRVSNIMQCVLCIRIAIYICHLSIYSNCIARYACIIVIDTEIKSKVRTMKCDVSKEKDMSAIKSQFGFVSTMLD